MNVLLERTSPAIKTGDLCPNDSENCRFHPLWRYARLAPPENPLRAHPTTQERPDSGDSDSKRRTITGIPAKGKQAARADDCAHAGLIRFCSPDRRCRCNATTAMRIVMRMRRSLTFALLGLFGALGAAVAPANAIEPPGLPATYVPARQAATLPPGNVLENLVVAPDGTVYFTSLFGRQILRCRAGMPATVVARTPFYPTGIVLRANGDLLVAGARYGLGDIRRRFDAQGMYHVSPTGHVERLGEVAHGAFFNGVEPLHDGSVLVADSVAGAIRRFDPRTRTFSIWLAGDFLRPQREPDFIPGANGIKILGSTAYISNSARAEMSAVTLDARQRPLRRRVILRGYSVDDFTFGTGGRLFVTTHGEHVIEIASNGSARIIAGSAQGVLGSTALAYGRRSDDRTSLYALSDGGTFESFFTHRKPQPAHLTLLKIGSPDPRR